MLAGQEQEQEGAHSYECSLAMRRDGESDRDRQGGRGLAWLVKSLVFYVKGKKKPWKISRRRKILLDWHFKTFLLGNQSDALERTLDSNKETGASPRFATSSCVFLDEPLPFLSLISSSIR